MLRRGAIALACLIVCGCQYPGQPAGSALPFGSARIPPPGTNSYPKPDVYTPPGATGSAVPASTTSPTSLSPGSLFNSNPQNGLNPASGSSWQPDASQGGVRFGDGALPPASSSIRLGGMPVNDATRPPARAANVGGAIPEITDLPRGSPYGAQPAAYNAPVYAPSLPAYGAGVPPAYAPGSIGSAASGASGTSFGWRSKTPESGGTLR